VKQYQFILMFNSNYSSILHYYCHNSFQQEAKLSLW